MENFANKLKKLNIIKILKYSKARIVALNYLLKPQSYNASRESKCCLAFLRTNNEKVSDF